MPYFVFVVTNVGFGRLMDKILLNIFTNRKKYDIIIVPNNLNIHSYRSFFRYGITIAFLL